MKTSRRLATRLICVLLLAGAIGVMVINQNTAARLRVENQELARVQTEARELERQNEGTQKLREENGEIQKLRAENKDLLKLRSEVRQLRREAEEVGKLTAENQRLNAARQNAATQKAVPVVLPGFVPKAAMADVGFGTPEAALQTSFWALCSGNLERLRQVMLGGGPPEGAEGEKERQEMMSQFERFPGFAITGRKDISPDEVTLEMKTSAGGAALPLKLKRVDGEWKMENH